MPLGAWMVSSVKRPILRYHGGKWKLAPWIISHLPSHKVYVEPFSGAGSVLLRKPRSRIEVLNDKYGRLVNVFRVLRDPDQAAQLHEALRLTPYAETEYQAAREPAKDPVEDARRMIVLGHQAHGSTGASGGKLSGWRRGVRPHGPTSADQWSDLYQHVLDWADRLRGVFLESTEASDILQRWDGPETVFYVDPPYTAQTRTEGLRGYAHEMSDDEHRELALILNQLQGHVILNGYDSELYNDELYREWTRVERSALADKAKRATEVLWISPHTPEAGLPLFQGLNR